jgi:hypothetical protein
MDITGLYNNFVVYVFGEPTLAALGMLFIITLIGVRFGWGLESFIIVLTPTVLVVLNGMLPLGLPALWLMGLGVLIGFGLLAMIRR